MQIETTSKKIGIIAVCLALASVVTAAQERKLKEKDVPPAVTAAFKSAYPNATVRGYEKEKENGKVFYEIESTDGSTLRDILYNPDGTVASIEETVAFKDLPVEAQQLMQTKYAKAVVSAAERVTEGNKVEYEVSARQGKKKISLVFDSDGKLLKSTVP
jgi:uncharacterized membrane protein YkoI